MPWLNEADGLGLMEILFVLILSFDFNAIPEGVDWVAVIFVCPALLFNIVYV